MSLHDCERLLTGLASGLECIYLVFDGLDESEHRQSFLQIIQNMVQSPKVRLLVTSRPHIRDLMDMFQHYPSLKIEANEDDLKTYLYQELEQGGIYDIAEQGFVKELVQKLMQGSEGMYAIPQTPNLLRFSVCFEVGNTAKCTFDLLGSFFQ